MKSNTMHSQLRRPPFATRRRGLVGGAAMFAAAVSIAAIVIPASKAAPKPKTVAAATPAALPAGAATPSAAEGAAQPPAPAASAGAPAAAGAVNERVLVIFDPKTRDIDRLFDVRSRIEASAGRVRLVLGLAGVVADVAPGSEPDLGVMPAVAGVARGPLARSPFDDPATLAAVAAWNRLNGSPPKAPATPPATRPKGDVIAPDLPKDDAAKRQQEADYNAHWKTQRAALAARLQRHGAVGCGTNGAGYNDTSLYLAGDVAVGVFYDDTASVWTAPGAATTFGDVVYSLNHFIDLQPNGRIVFTFSDEVDGAGTPLPSPSVPDRTYDNDLRNTWCTDWAYRLSVSNGGVWPFATLNGPTAHVDTTFSAFDYVIRHETGHIFGAGDQYPPLPPHEAYGYLQATQGNACGSDGTGYFAGAGECLPDLMNGWPYNDAISAYTAGQLGWHDTDGDGLLDVQETTPAINAASVAHSAANPPSFSGTATDRPLLDELPGFGSVSIERVAAVEYRVNNLPWQAAAASDGIYDSNTEGFVFSPPPLPNGTYTIQIRARNTAGAVTAIPYQEALVITGSATTNTRPFGTLKVTPTRAKVGTTLSAIGSLSRDIETPPSALNYSWNWDGLWTAWSPVATSTHTYATAGPHTAQMRVRDTASQVHVLATTVMSENYDTSPVVALRVTPERDHFAPGATYPVAATLVGTIDAETPYGALQARWDLDGDNVWDTAFSTQTTRSATLQDLYPIGKSDRRTVHVQVKDAAGDITDAYRAVWAVPYDHPPALNVTFAPASLTTTTATAIASDPDHATTWDGTLEYRWDIEGDGTWDTPFEHTPTLTIPTSFQTSLRVQVKDRFHALATWPSGLVH